MNANPDYDVPVSRDVPVAGDVTVVGETTEVNEPLAQTDTETSSMPETVSAEKPALAQIPSGPNVRDNPEANVLIEEATEILSKTPMKLIEARDKLNMALRMPMSDDQRKFVKNKLTELADKWLFTRKVYPDDPLCGTYKVKQGEILSNIGGRYKVPFESLMMVNNINNPRSLRAGQNIKVINGPFTVKVYRSTFTMDLYLQNTFVRSFIVGLGLPGKETPTGIWRVAADGKMERPIWYDEIENKTYFPEDPDYPLGSRWIALEGLEGEAKDREGFAIHGTKEPQQLGTQGSRGCIRLENGNAILVYNMLFPVESLVEVTD
jgi:LysM repeat protein